MAQSVADQISRVKQMASGDPTWDLSPNDIVALKTVLELLNGFVKGIKEDNTWIDEWCPVCQEHTPDHGCKQCPMKTLDEILSQ